MRHQQALRCLLTDLGSRGGTWHNGARLRPYSDAQLRVGDVVGFGDLGVEVVLAGADLQPPQKATAAALRHLPRLQVCVCGWV